MSTSLPESIQEIFYINLERNKLKRYLLENLLDRFSLPYRRVPGVICNIDEIQQTHSMASYLSTVDPSRLRGVTGCWLAHHNALSLIDKTRPGFTLILEDDFTCDDGFFEKLLKKVALLSEPFDIAIVDPRGLGPFENFKINEGIYRSGGKSFPYYCGSHCLLVRNSSADKILKAKSESSIMDYDGFLFCSSLLTNILIYTEQSGIINLGSDIGSSNKFKILINSIRYFINLKFKRKGDFA